LTGTPKSAFWFTASGDGTTIAFTAKHGKDPASREQVYVMAADGTDLRKVTDEPYGASEPALSFDGSEVAYKALRGPPSGLSRNVVVIDTHGVGVPAQLTHERKDVVSLAWSPTGDSILYSVAVPGRPLVGGSWGSSRLKKVDVATRESTDLAGGRRTPADFGTWSAGGSEIAYLTGDEWTDQAYGFDPAQIVVMNSDGANPHLVTSLDQRAFELAWRPYRPDLALTLQETSGSFGIYIFDVATREMRRVTNGMFPVWLDVHTLIVVR
jgi:Tol biopolymer transport system component